MLDIDTQYDVIVIGSGPSGNACAVRCGQLGLKTLCIDNAQVINQSGKLTPGIVSHPSSLETIILLESAVRYSSIKQYAKPHGIKVESVTLDLTEMLARKAKIIEKLSDDVIDQLDKNNVVFINGKAKLNAPGIVELTLLISSEKYQLKANHVVLATESLPITVPSVDVDNEYILDSIAALNLTSVPKHLAILGAGVLGLELANIWNRLGAKTILFDAQENFLGIVDHQISREAFKIFTDQGLDIQLGTRVLSTEISNKKVNINYQDPEGDYTIQVDRLIVASGRKPNTDNLTTSEVNLLLDGNGYVHTDECCRTNIPNVYAIGDLTIMAPMLAHKGIAEGRYVAELIANKLPLAINYKLIPNVIYTQPEIAWIGQTEQELSALGYPINTGTFKLVNNIKAIATDSNDGLAKIITCAKTDTILGVQLISSHASELISSAVIAMEFTANDEDINDAILPFPSLSQILINTSEAISRQ